MAISSIYKSKKNNITYIHLSYLFTVIGIYLQNMAHATDDKICIQVFLTCSIPCEIGGVWNMIGCRIA